MLTGKSVSRISNSSLPKDQQISLEDITSLHFSEDQNEIYTGSKRAVVTIWGQ
jgi:hypothetical protein